MAVILGLLLVVTFIANYLTTTLPNTMGQNDLQHNVLVENQVAQLGAVVQDTAEADVVGAQVSQPVTLGSAGAPPFAAQDRATITPLANQSLLTVHFNITNPTSGKVVPITSSTRNTSCGTAFCTGTGFVVHLLNTYASSAEVAYEQGAVVYAQPSSIPVFVVPPSITYTCVAQCNQAGMQGVLSLFVPQFSNRVSTEAGAGTAELSLRLLSAVPFAFPVTGFSLTSGQQVTVTVTTPYAATWYSYLQAYFQSFTTLSAQVSCAPTGSTSPCTALYEPGGPLGTVTLSVPVAGVSALDLLVGFYSFALA